MVLPQAGYADRPDHPGPAPHGLPHAQSMMLQRAASPAHMRQPSPNWRGAPNPAQMSNHHMAMNLPPCSEVAISIYELKGASALNTVMETVGLGGAYHVGVEVYWLEWSYGFTDRGSGVHAVHAGTSHMGELVERISLGRTPLRPEEVLRILATMRNEWRGEDYHYLRNNCGHFCETLIHRLCVPGKIPGWVTSLAESADSLTSWIGVDLFKPQVPAVKGHGKGKGKGRGLPMRHKGGHMHPGHFLALLREDQHLGKIELEWRWAQEYVIHRTREAIAYGAFQGQGPPPVQHSPAHPMSPRTQARMQAAPSFCAMQTQASPATPRFCEAWGQPQANYIMS